MLYELDTSPEAPFHRFMQSLRDRGGMVEPRLVAGHTKGDALPRTHHRFERKRGCLAYQLRERGCSHLAEAEAQAMEKMSTEQALRLVATLSPDIAEMVALRVIAGLDAGTVGDLVGKSAGAVRVAVHRALATLSGRPDVSPAEVNP